MANENEYDDAQHAAIVHRLRSAGWERWDAINEADRLMAERTQRQSQPKETDQ